LYGKHGWTRYVSTYMQFIPYLFTNKFFCAKYTIFHK